jgi:hypothetical protein
MTDFTPADPPPRRRLWPRLLLAAGVALAVCVGGSLWALALSNSDLKAAVADADRLDPGWRLDELEAKRDAPPDAENAAVQLLAVARRFPKDPVLTSALDAVTDLPPAARLHETQVAALRAALAESGPALAAARDLPRFTRSRYPIQWQPNVMSTVLTCQDARKVAAWLKVDALARAEAEDHAGALEACRAILHASRTVGDEPSGISQLVRIALKAIGLLALERLLAQGEPPADALAEVQRWLEEEDGVALLLTTLRGERAWTERALQDLYENVSPAQRVQLLVSPPSVHPYRTRAAAIRLLTELVEVAKLPERERPARWDAVMATTSDQPVLVGMLAPTIDKLATACRRSHAQTRCAIAAVVAERFRRDKGQWPATLNELVAAGFLRTVPADPYTVEPLRLRRTADGILIYTTGSDGKDDGGAIDRRTTTDNHGTDFGFELWDVPKRRGPPVPPKPKEPDDDPPPAGGMP